MPGPTNIEQLKQWSQAYTLQQKVAIFGSAAGALLLLWALVYFVNQADYRTLYTEMEPADAQAVLARLETIGVPYQLSDDGSRVSVPQDRLSEARIQLATEGFPASGQIGYELFDRTNFGLTNFQEQINFQRALEGELARSISDLAEVEAARVHLVMESRSLLRSASDDAKASVTLRLARGRSLEQARVQGIVHLVASSVKGLDPARVTVVDNSGALLSGSDHSAPISGRQIDQQLKMESDLADKVTRILESVVGVGGVRSQVALDVNFQKVEETIEEFDPEGSVVLAQQIRTERGPASVNIAQGIPGPQGAEDIDATGRFELPEYVTEDERINYEVSRSTRHIVDEFGGVEGISVAVLIDNKARLDVGEDGRVRTVSEPWTDVEMERFRGLVASAVGIDFGRGDSLTVENVPFGNDLIPVDPPTMIERNAPLILQALRYLIIPIVFFLAYLLFLRPLQRTIFANWAPSVKGELATASASAGSTQVSTLPAAQAPMSISQLEEALNTATLPALPDHAEGSREKRPDERDMLPLPQSNKAELVRSRILEHAQREPETVARLVRTWLNEDGRG